MTKKPIILCIIDGLGLRNETNGNGFKLANTPTFDTLFKECPNSIIQASGEFVGLPKEQMGNSEVGHLNIGAGQVVYTGLSLIGKSIKENTFKTNSKFIDVFKKCKENDTYLHLMGMLSPGGVHSLEDHLFLLLDAAYEYGLKKVSVHVFGDGRDVAPQSIIPSLEKLVNKINKYDFVLSSISGRFYAMDRDKMFERNEKAYQSLLGNSENTFDNVIDYINDQYNKNIYDEFIEPGISNHGQFIKNNDSIIFFNFRPDRARQLTHMFVGSNIYDYEPSIKINISMFISMMKYEGIDTIVAYPEMEVKNPIGKVISENNLKQLRLAETQKYAHVTFFMDGGKDIMYPNMDKKMIDSLKVESYAYAPHMSAKGITDYLIEHGCNYDLVIMNFANPDMVGHTGNLKATIEAVSFLDTQIKRIKDWIETTGGTLFITADHGNAELTEDENGNPLTKHTSNPVMLITTDKSIKLKDGKLANIAPTILDYMSIKKPNSMNEESLIVK